MTNKEQIELLNEGKGYADFIRTHERHQKDFEYYSNYVFYFIPALFVFVGVSIFIAFIKNNPENYIDLVISIAAFLMGMFLLHFTHKRFQQNLRFERVPCANFNIPIIEQMVYRNFKVESLEYDKKLEAIFIQTKISPFSWGEWITIVKDGPTLLVNSKPNSSRQPLTIFKDRANVRKMKAIIEEACCGSAN